MYIIEFECGCKVERNKCKKNRGTACPIHNNKERIKIIFRCEMCGMETDKTDKGTQITSIAVVRLICRDCKKKLEYMRHEGFTIRDLLKNGKIGKNKLLSNAEKSETGKKPDCRWYDYCLNKAAFASEPRQQKIRCIGCTRYEHKDLDIMNFVQYHGGIDSSKIERRPEPKDLTSLLNKMERMLKKKVVRNKNNFVCAIHNSTKDYEKNIQAAIERSANMQKG